MAAPAGKDGGKAKPLKAPKKAEKDYDEVSACVATGLDSAALIQLPQKPQLQPVCSKTPPLQSKLLTTIFRGGGVTA